MNSTYIPTTYFQLDIGHDHEAAAYRQDKEWYDLGDLCLPKVYNLLRSLRVDASAAKYMASATNYHKTMQIQWNWNLFLLTARPGDMIWIEDWCWEITEDMYKEWRRRNQHTRNEARDYERMWESGAKGISTVFYNIRHRPY